MIAREAFEVGLVRGHLRRSNRRPGQRIKRNHYILLTAEIRELYLLAFFHIARQLEIRGHISNFRHEMKIPPPGRSHQSLLYCFDEVRLTFFWMIGQGWAARIYLSNC